VKKQKLGEDGASLHIIESDNPSAASRKSRAGLIQIIYEKESKFLSIKYGSALTWLLLRHACCAQADDAGLSRPL
jgi:hypothetical protein